MTNKEAAELLEKLYLMADIRDEYGDFTDKSDFEEAVDMAIRALRQQKTAHLMFLDKCANAGYSCSNCSKKLVKLGWSGTVKKIKYCPNCGAKMDGKVLTMR